MWQLTKDHTLVQELVDAGIITPEQAQCHPSANVITRAIGSEGEIELDEVTGRFQAGDRFLLCSDGVSKTVPEVDLRKILSSATEPAEQMIAAALAQRSRDNVTAIAIEIRGKSISQTLPRDGEERRG
jgi:protein phosphatase/serine/threonine-protein phosphatase Stp1